MDFDLGQDRALLREIEIGGHAVRDLGLDDLEDALRRIDVVLGDGDAVAQRQHVEIGVGDVGGDGERHDALRIERRARIVLRRAQIVLRQAPEIDLIARVQRHAEGVARD